MTIGTVKILPPPDRRESVLELLRSIQGRVRAQAGCIACDVLDEQGPEHAVVLIERWETREALEEHLRSEPYRRVLAAVEMSGGQPEIRFEQVSSSEGIELIERLRSPARPR